MDHESQQCCLGIAETEISLPRPAWWSRSCSEQGWRLATAKIPFLCTPDKCRDVLDLQLLGPENDSASRNVQASSSGQAVSALQSLSRARKHSQGVSQQHPAGTNHLHRVHMCSHVPGAHPTGQRAQGQRPEGQQVTSPSPRAASQGYW